MIKIKIDEDGHLIIHHCGDIVVISSFQMKVLKTMLDDYEGGNIKNQWSSVLNIVSNPIERNKNGS